MKKLYKSETNRIVCGVCGGIAEYLGVDATVVRLITAILCIAGGSGILLYLAAAVIIPGAPVGETEGSSRAADTPKAEPEAKAEAKAEGEAEA